jgi:protein phosphatase
LKNLNDIKIYHWKGLWKMKVNCAYCTHPGKVRSVNQDGLFLDGEIVMEGNMTAPVITSRELREDCGLLAVVDGAGGHNAGGIACQIILAEMAERLLTTPASEICITGEMNHIQDKMTKMAKYEPWLSGMAATLAGLLVIPGGMGEALPGDMTMKRTASLECKEVLAFNCGDCRVYHVEERIMAKLTHDHSCVQTLFDDGVLSEDGMRTHPRKNIVTAALQARGEPVELCFRRVEVRSSSRFFICCDGIWETLPKKQIEKCTIVPSLQDAAHRLWSEVMNTECRDNISFILLDITG